MLRAKHKEKHPEIFTVLFLFLVTIILGARAVSIAYASETQIKVLDDITAVASSTATVESPTLTHIANGSTDLMLWYQADEQEKQQAETVQDIQEVADIGNDEIQERVTEYKKEQEKLKVASEMTTRSGMAGRLTIPSVGVDVALFYASRYNGTASQAIVDRVDSAAIITDWGVNKLIADHTNQGFSAIKNSVPGSTVAYINNGTTTTAYICTKKFNGTNTGSGLLDGSGYSVHQQNSGGLVMYTCNENWRSITITYWQPM